MLGGRKTYDKLRRMSKKKLDNLEYDHRQHLDRFAAAKRDKGEEAHGLDAPPSDINVETNLA